MGKLTRLFKAGILCLIVSICAPMIPAYASLGEIALSNSIENTPYYRVDFSDWDGELIGQVSYDSTSSSFVASSQFGDGFSKHLAKNANGYAQATTFWLKLSDFFKDAQPGKYSVKFKVKAHTPTPSNTEGKLTMKVLNIADSLNPNIAAKWVWKESQMSVCQTTQTDWMEVEYSFDYNGSMPEVADGYDRYALCLYFAPSAAVNGYWHSFDYEYIEVSRVEKAALSGYSGKTMTITSSVYNNTEESKSGLLINMLFDKNNRLYEAYGVKTQHITVDGGSVENYVWNIPVPAGADDAWNVRTYLWSDDGTFEAYCDEKTEFMQFNVNPEMEILDSGSSTGLLGWNEVIADSGASVSDECYAGAYSLKIPSGDGNGVSQNLGDMTKKYGLGTYRISVMAKSDTNSSIDIKYDTVSQAYDISDSWTECVFDFTVKAGATAMDIKILNSGSGDVCIDDAVITKVY